MTLQFELILCESVRDLPRFRIVTLRNVSPDICGANANTPALPIYQLAGTVHLDLEPASACRLDPGRQVLGGHSQSGEFRRPRCHTRPFEVFGTRCLAVAATRIVLRAGRQTDAGSRRADELSSLHDQSRV